MLFIRRGDLLDFKGDIIVQQCNCLGAVGGLAGVIQRQLKVTPNEEVMNSGHVSSSRLIGTIEFCEIKREVSRKVSFSHVVNFFSQYSGGCPSGNDTREMREKWFSSCLKNLRTQIEQRKIKKIAFPYGIGCVIGGGNWEKYFSLIKEWVKTLPEDCLVQIIKL